MTSASDDANRIERDLEHTRSRIDATIDALQEKLSPGQVVDQALTYFKEGSGGDFSRNLMTSVRDNPMPVALVGIGLTWLMMSGQRRDDDQDTRSIYQGRDYAPDYRDAGAAQAYADFGDEGYATGAAGISGSSLGSATTDYAGSSGYTGAGGYTNTSDYADTAYDRSNYNTYQGANMASTNTGPSSYDDLATRANEAGARLQRLSDESDDAYQERVYTARGSVVGVSRSVGETLSAFRDRVEQAVSAAADRFRQMGSSAASAASHMAGRGQATASSAYGHGQSAASGVYDYGRSAAAGVRDSASYAARRAQEAGMRSYDYVQDHPFVLGALGVTVGAILGMLVPPTRYERELLSGVRDNVRERAREVMSEASDRAVRVAESVLDTAQEATRREGLTVGDPREHAANLRGQVADTAARARGVVEETAAAAREAIRREASGQSNGESSDTRSSPSSGTQSSGASSTSGSSTAGTGGTSGTQGNIAGATGSQSNLAGAGAGSSTSSGSSLAGSTSGTQDKAPGSTSTTW